ncbi:MAG: ATP-binding protein [Bacteroidota bacterium]
MRLTSNNKYKSVDPLPGIPLPNFVVITGLNGSGKSQLLEGIANNRILLKVAHDRFIGSCKLVTSQTLAPNDSMIVTNQSLKQSSTNTYNQYVQYLKKARHHPSWALSNEIKDHKQVKIIEQIVRNAEKDITNLTADDFYRYYPIDDGLTQNDMFYQNFSILFKRYQVKQYNNQFRQFLKEKKGKDDVGYLTDEQFVQKYGEPPWIFVNQIVKEANLNYYINSPEDQEPDAAFELKLINKNNQAEIKFSDLSSGEKVLMSLGLALYNSKFDSSFPRVLLMDEPDASLHPSMIKQFLDVVQNVFIQEKQMKVIITTHSPSTVALAPEKSIFVMNKTGNRVEKTTKDKALKVLTSGVPSLSINYENRRQVFVESKYDVIFYDKVYDKLRGKLVQEVSISFISSGIDGQGNCDQVKDIVNKLVSFGNRTIYGIIDWDTKNNGNEYIKILGKDKRYSIENYIYDPLLLGAYLLREKFLPKMELGLRDNETYIDLRNFDDSKLQYIVDVISNKVKSIFQEPVDESLIVSSLINGRSVKIPKWYILYQGHELEKQLKSSFPHLNRFQREGDLKKEIISKVIDDIPEILSEDLLYLLKEVQNV